MDDRAARAWTESMAVRPLGGGRYAVDSQSGATYVVDLPERTCSCPDHLIRGERCKHLRRVALEVTLGRVPPPGKRRVACAACGIETFVPEADPEPHLCPDCRLDPGDRVVDRETGDWLHVVRVRPERAADVWLPDAECTVAEYPTNQAYPEDDLVVEAVYVGDVARTTEPKRYAFPRSRLERRAIKRFGDDSIDDGPEAMRTGIDRLTSTCQEFDQASSASVSKSPRLVRSLSPVNSAKSVPSDRAVSFLTR